MNRQSLPNDGLPTPQIGPWSLQKYRILGLYDTLFSTGMKRRWGLRVYIDLFAGPGRARIRGSRQIVETSPLLALRVPDPFDRYIFSDRNQTYVNALRTRVEREFPKADVRYFAGDCNCLVAEILAAVPEPSRGRSVLSFCFVDPYGIGEVQFDTIRSLSRYRMDFLILLALAMDAHRFQRLYTASGNLKIDHFLGDPTWREKWRQSRAEGVDFRRFLATRFALQMKHLGYLDTGLEKMMEVRSEEYNLPLYHLAFFSRHERGYQFWDQVLRYGIDQLSLFG